MTSEGSRTHPEFVAATRQHLQHDLAAYTALVAQAGGAAAHGDGTEVSRARDHLLRTLELAALAAKAAERGGEAVTLEALTDAWLRAHRG